MHFETSGDSVKLGLYFSKVDEEKRTVSGFATLDNVDSHGDIIDADGSIEAFRRFRGGLREMHTNNAVGTIVSFEEAKSYDNDDDKVYRGVYISAKVSKGAQDTWEKVLDGTLKGFSIGGKIKNVDSTEVEGRGKVKVIKDYDLIEVSLVDNPANPLANVLTVQKLGDTYIYSENDLSKATQNILYQEETGTVVLSESEDKDGFVNIGWVESDSDTEKIRDAVEKYKASKEDSEEEEEITLSLHKRDIVDAIASKILSKEVLNMPDNIIEKGEAAEETVEETVEAVAEEAAEEVVEEVSEEAAEAVEEEATEDEVEESEEVAKDASSELNVGEILSTIQEAVTGAVEKAVDAARESKEAAESVKSSFDETLSDVVKQISSLKDNLDGLVARVESVESTTAVKKSSDILVDEEDNDEEETNFWRGSGFLSATDLTKG